MRIRFERKALFGAKVHLLVVDQLRLLQLGYAGAAGRRGWATITDFDSVAEAEEGCRAVAEDLRQHGYREAEWTPEPAVDELASRLRA